MRKPKYIIIEDYNDPQFEAIRDDFYRHFISDDWSFIIIGKSGAVLDEVQRIHPSACSYACTKIEKGKYVAVSYHS